MFALPTVKAAATFSDSFPHVFKDNRAQGLVICGLDQEPLYRMAREVANKIGQVPPAMIYSRFVPSLQGMKTKMSGAEANVAILLSDPAADVKKKINKSAFSGGGATLEEHKKNGGRVDVDIPYQYLRFFLEDDAKLEEIRTRYSSGEMLTGEIKQAAIDCISRVVTEYAEKRKKVTDADLDKFMK
jgi:tryptophanyl-tRNA synthetase